MTAQLTELSQRDVARRIVRAHNKEFRDDLPADVRRQGFLVFDKRGRLLRWMSGISTEFALIAPHEIAFRLHALKVTTADVILFLQARDGSTPHRDQAQLYGATRRRPVEEVVL